MQKISIRFIFLLVCFLSLMISNRLYAEDLPNIQGNMETAIKDFSNLNDSQKKAILGATGLPDMGTGGFSVANLMAWIIFGGVGFIAFVYGKKVGNFKALLIGIVLMGYPYFVTNTLALYGVGAALCAALYFWRD